MLTLWERHRVLSAPSNRSSSLQDTLATLDIMPLAAEWVAEYKQAKLEEMICQLRPNRAEEITEREFGDWEYNELRRLRNKTERHELSSDAPLIRFWRMRCG